MIRSIPVMSRAPVLSSCDRMAVIRSPGWRSGKALMAYAVIWFPCASPRVPMLSSATEATHQ